MTAIKWFAYAVGAAYLVFGGGVRAEVTWYLTAPAPPLGSSRDPEGATWSLARLDQHHTWNLRVI